MVGIALLPRLLSDFRAGQAGLVAVYFVALIGLNVLTGLSGQVSLGHGAFMAVGGYVTAILVSEQGLELFGHTFSSDVRDIWTLPLAGILAGVAGILFGLPATRLAGAYLALATFGIGVALPAVLRKAESLTGGGNGINLFGLPRLSGLGVEVDVLGRTLTYNDWLYYSCWTVALVLLAASSLLLRGRLGRSLRAVRDAEPAALSSGVNPMAAKTARVRHLRLLRGRGGRPLRDAHDLRQPGSLRRDAVDLPARRRRRRRLGTMWTQAFGAAFIVFLPDVAQAISKEPGVPAIVYAVVLIGLMLVLPGGVGGLVRRLSTPLTSRWHSGS